MKIFYILVCSFVLLSGCAKMPNSSASIKPLPTLAGADSSKNSAGISDDKTRELHTADSLSTPSEKPKKTVAITAGKTKKNLTAIPEKNKENLTPTKKKIMVNGIWIS